MLPIFLLAVLVVVDAGADDADAAVGEEDGGGRSFISDRSQFANEDSIRLLLSSGNKFEVISYADSSVAESSPSSRLVDDCNDGTKHVVRPGCRRVVVLAAEVKRGGAS